MGDGKWETNGVKVNHPTPRLGFDAFESRTTLAVLENTVAQRKQKTGAYRLMNVELPRPFYISSWDKCQTFSLPAFQKQLCPAASWDASLLKRHGNPHFSVTGSGSSLLVSGSREPDGSKTSTKTGFSSTGVGRCCLARGLPLLKDGQQDFFMSFGKWEMANGQWHIGQ